MAQKMDMKHGAQASEVGMLLGLACGDALGRPVEGMSETAIQTKHGRIEDMVEGRGPPGTITDDTELALCIARSLDESGMFDPEDVAARFLEWYKSNPLSIGMTTEWAVYDLSTGFTWDEAGKRAWEGSNAGNGSVMRCAPLALAYQDDPIMLIETSIQSSVITHYDPRCVCGCAVLNLTLAGILDGTTNPLERALNILDGRAPTEMIEALRPICEMNPDTPTNLMDEPSGHVLNTLRASLSYGLSAESAESGIITAINAGGDADTIGAITGAIVGARFGADELPERWLSVIEEREDLTRLSHSLTDNQFELSSEAAAYNYNFSEEF